MIVQISDQAILQAVDRFSALRGQGLVASLLAFSRALQQVGIKVSLSQVIDTARSLALVDIACKADFYIVLRANLVCERPDMALFDRVFDCFWNDRVPEESPRELVEALTIQAEKTRWKSDDPGGSVKVEAEAASPNSELNKESGHFPFPTYSLHEALNKKDFSELGIEESRAMSRAILVIAAKIATQVSRRRQRAAKGDEIDLRWSMRKNVKYGGEILELVSRKQRIKKTRIVLLCDVSGSMDCYSRFLIEFMYGLQNELWGVETFVFSTSLSRITHFLRTRGIGRALEKISSHVLGWSGGTNIGSSLYTFNREFASTLVTHRTVIVIISDGWDRGDTGLLEQEMRNLKRRCHKIIWLNPLLASENYEPLCKGMQAALSHLDFLLPVHNLHSLMVLGRTLQGLDVG
jgi:uncharacterized protein with von Willebrand factor type A (vWA) domain